MKYFLAPTSATRLLQFERLFTLSFACYQLYLLLHWKEWLTTAGFHLRENAMRASFPYSAPLLEPWQVLLAAIIVGSATLAVVVGKRHRAALAILFLWAVYIQLADIVTAFTLNKIYIVTFLILLLSPVEGDKLRARWPITVLQLTLVAMYGGAGFAKAVHGDWLLYSDALWTQVQGIYRTDFAAWLLLVLPKWSWTAMQHSALAFELFAPLLFLWRRLLPIGIVVGLGFHIIIALCMELLIFFSFQMIWFDSTKCLILVPVS